MRALSVTLSIVLALAFAACGPGAVPGTGARESGQSKLMDQTFAGQHTCNPKDQDRPFVIEWDATDTSSFQARAANDVVVVQYDGCHLTVLDSCNDDSVRGLFGSYRPIEWTTGAVERVDIANAIDLHAKLPLGEALLGGRVQAGEKFHMEYFVSGTRSATRPVLYRGDLAKVPGCAGATHFVYAFNLGAYELATQTQTSGSASVSAFGAAAGGASTRASDVAKKAGEIASCRSDSAKEVDGCKVPIRLTLREIADGDGPDQQSARAPESPAAANLAGRLEARTDRERKAEEHLRAAYAKSNAEDGKGCLAELDQHDKLDPRPEGLSTSARGNASVRARCLMLSAQCAAGRALARKAIEARGTAANADRVDDEVDQIAGQSCRGGALTDRDRLLVALATLTSDKSRSIADCRRAYDDTTKLIPVVTKRSETDPIRNAQSWLEDHGPRCFAKAGDCATAWKVTKEVQATYAKRMNVDPSLGRTRYALIATTKSLCIDKDQGPMTDAEEAVRWRLELEEADARSRALCNARFEKGLAALKRMTASGGVGEGSDPLFLAQAAAKCFAAVNDCDASWRRYVEARTATKPVRIDDSMIGSYYDSAPACLAKPAPASLAAEEKIAWARVQLRKAKDAPACQAAYGAIERLAPEAPPARDPSFVKWWDGYRDVPGAAAQCFERANDCKAAWTTYQRAVARFDPRIKPEDRKKEYERAANRCSSR